MDTGEPLTAIRAQVERANVYFGAFPVAEALGLGAEIVITGRVADAALTLAPMIHEFGWKETEWDKLAAGIVAGHAIECGAQATGGNCQVDWETIPNLADIGYPIVEAEPDGTFSSPSMRAPAGASRWPRSKSRSSTKSAIRAVHHARLRRRFHHGAAGTGRARSCPLHRHQGTARHELLQGSISYTAG